MNAAEQQLKQHLEQWVELKKGRIVNGAAYHGVEDFLLQHGVWYRAEMIPDYQGAQKACFGNAMLIAMVRGYRYVEGYALAPKIPMPIHHAWNLDKQGRLYDSTWMNTALAYIGVEFSVGRADNAIWFDDATVLDNPRNRFKILREPWAGENYNLVWRKSKMRKLVESKK